MAKSEQHRVAMLDSAIAMISKGLTYAETAVRTGFPYWLISGSIRKIYVPVLSEEKDRIEEYAAEHQTTGPQVVMDIVNLYWDDYVKLSATKKKKKARKIRAVK